jgi:hypothetical protein
MPYSPGALDQFDRSLFDAVIDQVLADNLAHRLWPMPDRIQAQNLCKPKAMMVAAMMA